MNKLRTTTLSCLLVLGLAFPAFAQEGGEGGEAKPEEGQPADPGATPETPATPAEQTATDDALKRKESDLAPTTPVLTTGPMKKGDAMKTWKDIVVIPRKPILKSGRVELSPYFATTINDSLIQHYAIGGEVSYFITDILSVGLQGQYYFKDVLDTEFWTRYQFGRISSLNKYIYTVAANFSYMPFYGKFALFNKHILHWEVYIAAGLGMTGTEVIPRNYDFKPFKNMTQMTFKIPGIGARLLITRWLAAHVSFTHWLILDKLEPMDRDTFNPETKKQMTPDEEAGYAKGKADSRAICNMMFQMGVSFFLPADFKYTTFR